MIYACLKDAHNQSQTNLSLFSWADEVANSNIMFKYWLLILKFQIDYLVVVRSLREGRFHLFINVLLSLVKWFLIFDQHHYSRWISVHLQELLTLKITCPDLYKEFSTGNFVVQISNREFSRIHYNQAHEQCNKVIKSISGPINFVNRSDESLQRRWEIAGPEIALYLQYIEENIFKSESSDKVFSHHEDNPSHNRIFLKDCAIITARLKAVNPFMEEAFVNAGTSCKYNNNVHAFVKSIPDIGQTKYEEFVENQLVKGKLRVSDTIKKKNFETPLTKQKKTPGKKIIALTEADFNKLRSAISSRPQQCEALFPSEFTFYPESLTKNQEMYHGNKSIALDI